MMDMRFLNRVIVMKKLNRKGYMLVEIILASAIAFGVAYFMLDLTMKMKNKNDDMVVSTLVSTDQVIVTKKLMDYAISEKKEFDCAELDISNKAIMYRGNTINILNEYVGNITKDDIVCTNDQEKGSIHIDIPLFVKQLRKKDFNITVDYKYSTLNNTPTCSRITENYTCANNASGSNPVFTYTGNCEVICEDDNKENWRIKFLTTGELSLSMNMNIDAFLVGGGGHGNNSRGGGGGYTTTIKDINIKKGYNYIVNIGASEEETSIKENNGNVLGNALGGKGKDGGNLGGLSGASGNYCNGPGTGECEGQYWCNDCSNGKVYGTNGETCEFGEGTKDGCTRGNEFSYAVGGRGGGCCTGHDYTEKGLTGDNSGHGGDGNKEGSTGIVVIRNKR